jgi:predicted MPP superfamily phosphohydrolase
MRRFLLVFTSLLSAITAYTGWRLADSPWQWAGLAILAALLLLFPLLHWRERGNAAEPSPHSLQVLSFVSMGVFSWLFVVAIFRDLLLLVLWLFTERASAFAAVTKGNPSMLAAMALTLIGMFWAARGLRLKRVKVPGFPAGLKVAQISDLHIGPTLGLRYVKRVVKLVKQAAPDITVLTGDIVDGDIRLLSQALAPLADLPGKVFFVPGNHEYYWHFPDWASELEKLGITILINRGEGVGRVWVGGVPDTMLMGTPDAPDAEAALRGAGEGDYRILLSHRPDLVEAAAKAGFHLQLSGHTHGGQFFPWTFVGKYFHMYYLGLMRHEKMWIYVSPGTGTWGPPIRLGTTPEVTLLTGEA